MANLQNPPNTLLYTRSQNAPDFDDSPRRAKYLIYFLPGNPGLVEYYKIFLKALHEQLVHSSGGLDQRVDVLGITLAGFECGEADIEDISKKERKLPVSIDGQLDFVEDKLKDYIEPDTRIILMGHSLGAYLLMEILRRRQSRLETKGRVIGAIGLFPAVVHLAKSEGGRRAQRFLAVPGLVLLVIWLARMLGLLPTKILHEGIRVFLGYPDHAVKTTAHWIRSQWGVEQSIHNGREELSRISNDTWYDEVWGTNVHLLFGEQDSYVPEIDRDALISARAPQGTVQTGNTPHFELAATGIPHDFSIRHSKSVAEKAAEWVRDIINHADA